MHKYFAKFPLDIEKKAFIELKEYIRQSREKDKKRVNFFRVVDKKITLHILNNNITLVETLHEIPRAFEKLFQDIYNELIDKDPELHIIHLFNSISPDDLLTRKWICSLFSPYAFDPYYESIDLLKGDGVARMHGKLLSGVPMNAFLVGQILDNLLWDFEHYRCIDAVKETGVKESIEELRKNRIYYTTESIIWDYSPLIKRELSRSGIIIEVFTKEDFEKAKKNKKLFMQEVDRILCANIQEIPGDPRENIYFGNRVDSGFKYTVRFGSKEETVLIQLLPKYWPYILDTSKRYDITKLRKGPRGKVEIEAVPRRVDRVIQEKITANRITEGETQKKEEVYEEFAETPSIFKEDETQEALEGLIKGARTWNEGKGPATPWLKQNVIWQLGKSFEALSTEVEKKEPSGTGSDTPHAHKNRMLWEDIESSGCRLDDQIKNDEGESEETYKDLIKHEDALEIEDKIILSEIFKKRA